MTEQLSFPMPTPQARKMPPEPIVRSADVDGPYRFVLRRAWGAGPCAMWCGLNPSLADGRRDDPTMLREIGFSYRWGFGSLVKVNIYPFVTAKPAEMREWLAAANREVREDPAQVWPFSKSPLAALLRNQAAVRDAIADTTVHIAAWGNGAEEIDVEEFLTEVAHRQVDTSEHDGLGVVSVPVDWHCLGRNENGSPKHTLARGAYRVSDDAKLVLWRSA